MAFLRSLPARRFALGLIIVAVLGTLLIQSIRSHKQTSPAPPEQTASSSPTSPIEPQPPSASSANAVADALPGDQGTLLLRFPDVCGDRIVFTYAGDLWTVSTHGGTATRLTAGPGLEQSARFSPDCKQVAFTGQYEGDDQVYVIDANGGQPRQLTYYPNLAISIPDFLGFEHQVYGWTPDGTRVLFRSYRDSWSVRQPRLYTVPVAGGLPEVLPMPSSGGGRYSPDGKQLVYTPWFRDFSAWNRYKGGWAQSLYIYDVEGKTARKITDDPYSERDPMWIDGAIYYISDRDDHGNLYRYDVASKQTAQLTHHRDSDARWASSDRKGQIVYEYGGSLHLYDVRDNSDKALQIHVPSDLPAMRASERNVSNLIEGVNLSPNGKRALIVARGEIFDLALQHGTALDLTNTPGAHEREAVWSTDGQQIAYVSDESGEEAIWVRSPNGLQPPRQLTHTVYGRLSTLRWSPDGKRIAFFDNNQYLHIIEVASGQVVEVSRNPTVIERDLGKDYTWSPSGRYLAYTLDADNLMPAIFVYDTSTSHSARVSPEPFASTNPAFSPDGKYLYFISAREWTPQISSVEWEIASNRTQLIYAATLRKDVVSPFPLRDDPAASPAKPANDAGQGSAGGHDSVNDRIDFDGITDRVVRAPLDADNYANLSVTPKALIYTVSDAKYYGREGGIKTKLQRFDVVQRKEQTLADEDSTLTGCKGLDGGYSLSADNSTALYCGSEQDYKTIALDQGDAKPANVKTDTLYAHVDPKVEFPEILRETWRRYRDYFYAENMNGYDWPALLTKYQKQLPYVGDRSDLNYLMSQMAAELSSSHVYISGGDLRLPAHPTVGMLGARYALDTPSNRYRIARILQGDNAEERYRSPLTELGVNVHEGDYLLAINGQQLMGNDNPYRLMRAAPGQLMKITVNSRPSMDGARIELVRPLSSEHPLVYYDWVAQNRAYVARRSGGRLGYIHLPNTFTDGIREFMKWYYPQIHAKGLIIDIRGNGGGNTSEMIIERLSRKLLGMGFWRGYDNPDTYPQQIFIGYLAMLADGTTASDGDTFAYMFQQAKLGPVIGTRTWGGVVGFDDWGPVVDGGTIDVPQYFATANTKGELSVEGEGVKPDIDVPVDVARAVQGDDVQLDSAIDYLDKQIENKPPILPKRPPNINKAPLDMRPAAAATVH